MALSRRMEKSAALPLGVLEKYNACKGDGSAMHGPKTNHLMHAVCHVHV